MNRNWCNDTASANPRSGKPFAILSSEGILTSIPRYGYQVISFNLSNVRAIMEFRAVLEDYVLCKSFPALTPASIAHLEELALQTSEWGDIWEHWTLNENFHLALSSLAENEYLYLQLKKTMHFLKLAYAQFYWSHWNNTSLPNDLKNRTRIFKLPQSRRSGIGADRLERRSR